ncbi:MAG TPA: hypothetical protein VKW77_03480 [Acidimicrobiales bacterium]|nr:hypothetical protein [Acidimicrobiales bacterium]
MTAPTDTSPEVPEAHEHEDESRSASPSTPGDALRALPVEAQERGTRFVSAQAMQARLFSVYDAAAAAEGALRLVQDQLTRTLDRRYYDAAEIEAMAAQLDALLALETAEPAVTEPAAGTSPGPAAET